MNRALPMLLGLLAASPGLAQAPAETRAPPPPPADGARTQAPPVRASHRVDVIAPGEKVETIIDRMRARAPEATTRGQPAARPDARPGNPPKPGVRPPGRPGPGHGPQGGPRPGGPGPGAGPGGMPGPGPMPGDAPPPDRPPHH